MNRSGNDSLAVGELFTQSALFAHTPEGDNALLYATPCTG